MSLDKENLLNYITKVKHVCGVFSLMGAIVQPRKCTHPQGYTQSVHGDRNKQFNSNDFQQVKYFVSSVKWLFLN